MSELWDQHTKTDLSLIKSEKQVGRAGQYPSGPVNQVVSGGNWVRVGLEHLRSLDKLGGGVLHPEEKEKQLS